MPTVTFIEHNGTAHTVEAPPERSLMQIALDNGVPGILGDCGGACSCATCHGHVEVPWRTRMPSLTETESFMLDAVAERSEGSRLCCQIRVTPELDGMIVRLPAEQS